MARGVARGGVGGANARFWAVPDEVRSGDERRAKKRPDGVRLWSRGVGKSREVVVG